MSKSPAEARQTRVWRGAAARLFRFRSRPAVHRATFLLYGALYLAGGILAFHLAGSTGEGGLRAEAKNLSREDRQELIRIAKEYLDTPYRYGGTGRQGFDCSGFVQFVYGRVGVNLPRSTRAQFRFTRPVQEPGRGDLIFFKINGQQISHVGLYVGERRFIHSPSTGKKIRISSLENRYWKERFAGARSVSR